MTDKSWIDTHVHLWEVSRGDYYWMSPDLKPLYRDYTPDDFRTASADTPTHKAVLIQATTTVAETEYLLSIAHKDNDALGVVGWVDFDNQQQALQDIARFAKDPYFKGVRPMLQEIEDRDYILNPDFDVLFKALMEHGLHYEFLIFPDGLSAAQKIAEKYPNLPMIIDHCAKPQIRNGIDGQHGLKDWQQSMAPFADMSHVYVKISGILTESNDGAGYDDLQPYVSWLLETFDHNRLVWGSDWPVLNMANTYQGWSGMMQKFASTLSPESQQRITQDNAIKFYRL